MSAIKAKLDKGATLPKRATYGSAAVDLYANLIGNVSIYPGQSLTIGTGVRVQLPLNTAMLILPRSGLGAKKGIVLGNLLGLIDTDYRGEIKVSIWNRNHEGPPYTIMPGQRIAQAVLLPIIRIDFEVAEELDTTERGEGGFGHTGQ